MKMYDFSRPSAAWAATEFARLPVDAHATVSKPNSRAFVTATATTRSLKRPGRVAHGVVLDPHLAAAELVGEVLRADERREADVMADRDVAVDRQEVLVPPHARRPGLDRGAGDDAPQRVVPIVDLEGAKTELAHVDRRRRVVAATLTTSQAVQLFHFPSPSVGELSPEFCCTDSKTFASLNTQLRVPSIRSARRRPSRAGAPPAEALISGRDVRAGRPLRRGGGPAGRGATPA